ncbi:DnaB-like helicase C-terminal domain-containing protein [bacterium]|nr:DnaB-like helicase C-terminal domain-containing protein [bacterium]MBQ9149311.1 DnaB-like helicase C-terminal domain-containing protein [bacterium]
MIDEKILEKICNDIFEERKPVLNTGFQELDILLKNLELSSLITIGGRPAMGKKAFMTTVMLNLLNQKKKCLYFSFSMSEILLIKRLIANLAEIDSNVLNNPNLLSAKNADKIMDTINKISKFDLTINDNNNSIEEIKTCIEKEQYDFVFIDCLQYINISNKKNRNENIEEVINKLKKIAKENNCIIFVGSQLSRAVENRYDKRPILSDLRDSGGIENISDVVMLIYREEYYDYVKEDALNKGKAEIIVAKNKYGPTACVDLLFKNSIIKFMEPIHYEKF